MENHLQNAILGGYVSSLKGTTCMCFRSEYRWSYHPEYLDAGRSGSYSSYEYSDEDTPRHSAFRTETTKNTNKTQQNINTCIKPSTLVLKLKRFKYIILWYIYNTKFWSHPCVTQVNCAFCSLLCISWTFLATERPCHGSLRRIP